MLVSTYMDVAEYQLVVVLHALQTNTALVAQASLQHGPLPLVQQVTISPPSTQPQPMELAQDVRSTNTALVAQTNLYHGPSQLVLQALTSVQLHLPLSMGLALHA